MGKSPEEVSCIESKSGIDGIIASGLSGFVLYILFAHSEVFINFVEKHNIALGIVSFLYCIAVGVFGCEQNESRMGKVFGIVGGVAVPFFILLGIFSQYLMADTAVGGVYDMVPVPDHMDYKSLINALISGAVSASGYFLLLVFSGVAHAVASENE